MKELKKRFDNAEKKYNESKQEFRNIIENAVKKHGQKEVENKIGRCDKYLSVTLSRDSYDVLKEVARLIVNKYDR